MAAAGLLLLLHLLSNSIFLASGSKDCHADDKTALLAIKAAFSPSYLDMSWLSDAAPCCDWYGIECEHDIDIDRSWGRVTSLAFLRDANLTGAVPGDAIAGLTHLQELLFFKVPGVSGPIPDSLAKLSGLTSLTISRTGVSGAIPSFVGSFTKLQELRLSFNSLTGAIPASLAAPPQLIVIDLSRNRLTGSIPPLLFSKFVPSTYESGVYLTLSHNNLSGSIPAQFAAVSFLGFDVSRNQLTGDASPVLSGRGRPVVTVNLARNRLSFNMSGVEFPDKVNDVDLSHNAIYGGIPARVGNLTDLQQFNVSYNRLCGELPAGLSRFDVYNFQHNKCLCGAPLAAACATASSRH
ncbi:hypothetical protein U9M48_030822 [Paspalum notatum var. saurae]|uniref:Leucine-rich repeat-containing N-terminal plant-type domain-containing protein n=1 Tax=Paspalum notatum var. saurae TaxID=547442 RepID=A0AAQ3U1H4_PASNO